MVAPLDHDFCYEAIARRDRTFDGKFWVGVLTTGVFCRPGCSARTPLSKNVRFYDSIEAAIDAGFRPCLRCRPITDLPASSPHLATMRKIYRMIREQSDQEFSTEDLANRARLSASHFPRVFRECIGVSPREYADACRGDRLRQLLRASRPVGEAIEAAGYGSVSRVYERTGDQLGMTPRQFGKGGKGISISYAEVSTELGWLMIAGTDRGVCWVQFGDSAEGLRLHLEKEFPLASVQKMDADSQPLLQPWVEALRRHLAGDLQTFSGLPIDIAGTAFQAKVWKFLRTIPAGEIRSYAEVAAGIGQPTSVRAVARACASNRIAVLIPCHRVLRGTGEMAGYRWGIERKIALIRLEKN